jgi:hypothetical protein
MGFSALQRIISVFRQSACTRFEDIISAMADDMATPAEIAAVQEHVKTCKSCQSFQSILNQSRVALRERPIREIPAALNIRLMDALAAERDAQVKNIKRGGGIGRPVRSQLVWAGGLAAAACAAVLFAVFVPNRSALNAPTNLKTGEHSVVIAQLPKGSEVVSVVKPSSRSTQTHSMEVASNINPTLLKFANTDETQPTHHRRALPQFEIKTPTVQIGSTKQIAELTTGAGMHSRIAPIPLRTGQNIVNHESIAALPKLHGPAEISVPSVTLPTAESSKPVETASLPNDLHTAIESANPAQGVDSNSHPQLGVALRQLARRTQIASSVSVSLTSFNGHVNYSNSVEMVGSSFR